eukprot:snap_masked-scaffold_20-processed-gene-4.40-mRNA-1 protein AED:1.00 eAED:1.00 QI:0/-1/0/0/-1/1/1/0/345
MKKLDPCTINELNEAIAGDCLLQEDNCPVERKAWYEFTANLEEATIKKDIISVDAFMKRQSEWMDSKNEKIEKARELAAIKREEKESKHAFMPQLNPSKGMKERNYFRHIKQWQEKKLSKIRQKKINSDRVKQETEMKACTFKPKTNCKSDNKYSKRRYVRKNNHKKTIFHRDTDIFYDVCSPRTKQSILNYYSRQKSAQVEAKRKENIFSQFALRWQRRGRSKSPIQSQVYTIRSERTKTRTSEKLSEYFSRQTNSLETSLCKETSFKGSLPPEERPSSLFAREESIPNIPTVKDEYPKELFDFENELQRLSLNKDLIKEAKNEALSITKQLLLDIKKNAQNKT